jgi:Fur family ferric uptake transcriptional regulator
MHVHPDAAPDDASGLRARGLRVTGPRLAILATLREVGGHRSADEVVGALRVGGYLHARTTVYNALDDLTRAGLVQAAPVDAGALRYEIASGRHDHFVCRDCGLIINVPVAPDLANRSVPAIVGATADQVDVIYRGFCASCEAQRAERADPVGGGNRSEAATGDEGAPPASMSPAARADISFDEGVGRLDEMTALG